MNMPFGAVVANLSTTELTVVVGVFGLVIGSFLNVVIYRVPLGLSVVRPGSRCPSCEHPLAGIDNIPVFSWLMLRGRCRYCSARISARYVLIELLTGAWFAAVTGLDGKHLDLVGSIAIVVAIVVAIAVEFDTGPVPKLFVVLAGAGALEQVALAGIDRQWHELALALVTAAGAGAVALTAGRLPDPTLSVFAAALAIGATTWWRPGGIAVVVGALVAAALIRTHRSPWPRNLTNLAFITAGGLAAVAIGVVVRLS